MNLLPALLAANTTGGSDFKDVLDRYGIPLAILVFCGWFFNKHIWPLLLRQMEATKKQADEANIRLEASQKAFLETLELQRKALEEAIRRFDGVVKKRRKPAN